MREKAARLNLLVGFCGDYHIGVELADDSGNRGNGGGPIRSGAHKNLGVNGIAAGSGQGSVKERAVRLAQVQVLKVRRNPHHLIHLIPASRKFLPKSVLSRPESPGHGETDDRGGGSGGPSRMFVKSAVANDRNFHGLEIIRRDEIGDGLGFAGLGSGAGNRDSREITSDARQHGGSGNAGDSGKRGEAIA